MNLATIPGGEGAPPEPDWSLILTDEIDLASARDHWREILSDLRMAGTLSVTNGHTIKRLVLFRIEFDRSARSVAEKGKVLPAKRSKAPQLNLEWVGMKQAADASSTLEAELGLTPRRRGAVTKVQRGKKASSAADSYLGPRKAG